jgi:hypothetical protein
VGEWDGERPGIFAHFECELSVVRRHEGVAFVIPLQKGLASGLVGNRIAGRDDLLAAWAKDGSEARRIAFARCLDEGGTRIL